MTDSIPHSTVADMLAALSDDYDLAPVGSWKRDRTISRVALIHDIDPTAPEADTLLVVPNRDVASMTAMAADWTAPFPLLVLSDDRESPRPDDLSPEIPVILVRGGFSTTSFLTAVSRWLDPSEAATARKLASIQAKYSLSLTHSDPMQALFRRVSRQLGGTVALVDAAGRIHSSSGPLPMSQVGPSLSGNAAPTVRIRTPQWSGAAIHINIGGSGGGQGAGWLIGLVPAPQQFDAGQFAALQLAAPLFDTILLLRSATQEQERAANSALITEALAFRPTRQDADIQSKMLSSGISFEEDLHVLVLQPKTSHAASARRQVKHLVPELKGILDSAGVRNLVSERDQHVVVLAQAHLGDLKRIIMAAGQQLGQPRAGAGRRVDSVADIASSYQDATLALRIDALSTAPRSFVAAKNFDFAFQLFSEVGLDRMIEWAQQFFTPLWEREPLLSGLQAYFAFDQNMNAAAAALGIHHNSLRYRISKAEEELNLSLRSPSSISSVFLALTALELGHQLRPFVARSPLQHIATGETPPAVDAEERPRTLEPSTGVVLDDKG
ncbi:MULTISPECIES: PucR family transcriptional regulator [unclassified Microbacterium]|uniref:PucR family transcriptional regulator n=1 Tax=unclassified Microbacterium TaxID=2609290 RepID=UPI0034661BD7